MNPKLSKISNSDDNLVIACKKNLTIEILCKKRFILAYLINNLVMCTFKSCLQREEQSKLLEIALGYDFILKSSNKKISDSRLICIANFKKDNFLCPYCVGWRRFITKLLLWAVKDSFRSLTFVATLVPFWFTSWRKYQWQNYFRFVYPVILSNFCIRFSTKNTSNTFRSFKK